MNSYNYYSCARFQKILLEKRGVNLGDRTILNFIVTTAMVLFFCSFHFYVLIPQFGIVTNQAEQGGLVNSGLWDIMGTDQFGAIIGVLTLATTVYFTKTLVDNDNKREKRVELEREELRRQAIIDWCINDWKKCGSSGGMIQTTGNNLIRRFGKGKGQIITDSYEIYANQQSSGSGVLSRQKFLETMRMYSNENEKIWPEA